MEKLLIVFDEVEILEWYDGTVRGVCKTENEIYLSILVAWDIEQSIKLNTLLKLDESTKNKFTKELSSNRSIEENWEMFNQVFDDYLKSYAGEVYLTQEEIKKNVSYNLTKINSNFIKTLVSYEFEDTMNRVNIDFWLGILKS